LQHTGHPALAKIRAAFANACEALGAVTILLFSLMKPTTIAIAAAFAAAVQVQAGTPAKTAKEMISENWLEHRIEPVNNPLFFEDPQIISEVRPIFMYHTIDNEFITRGGDVHVYAVQLRWAITPRLAFIATKDGYIDFDPSEGLEDQEGWADIGAGFKYALVDDRAHEFLLTPGFKFEFPSGNRDVFQGNGSGAWDLFIAAAKGFGDFHLTANVGFVIPNDFTEETSQFHFSAQADYWVCRYFIPFVTVDGFTVLTEADKLPLDVEGYDLINFGSSRAGGLTQVAVGAGFRSRVLDNLDLGFGYSKLVTEPKGLYDQRFTVDLIWRF
jgi:hypothetical protein